MLRESAALEAEDRVGASFLDELLAGDAVSPERIRLAASRLGYDLRVPQLVVAMQRHSRGSAGAPVSGESAARDLQAAVEGELGRRQVRCLIRAWEERVAVLYSAPNGQPKTGELLEAVRGSAVGLGIPYRRA